MSAGVKTALARRCVVWHQVGVAPRAELVGALSSRGLRVEVSGSGHEVVAMGCAGQQRIDHGGGGLIVVLDGGGKRLVDQERVLEALERFCPSALVWVYAEGANPPLRGFVGKGGAVGATAPVRAAPVKASGPVNEGPRLRLAGGSGEGGMGSALRASDVLDGDELAALLKPHDGKR